eukprot:evm.model.NODE_8154_length_37443_cov_19.801191.2
MGIPAAFHVVVAHVCGVGPTEAHELTYEDAAEEEGPNDGFEVHCFGATEHDCSWDDISNLRVRRGCHVVGRGNGMSKKLGLL